jgi:hypothetical protein
MAGFQVSINGRFWVSTEVLEGKGRAVALDDRLYRSRPDRICHVARKSPRLRRSNDGNYRSSAPQAAIELHVLRSAARAVEAPLTAAKQRGVCQRSEEQQMETLNDAI